MAIEHYKGNLSPSLTDTISIGGAAFDLTGSTVVFRMRAVGSPDLKIDDEAAIVDAPTGAVRYDWVAADVDTEGDYLAWWHVVLPSSNTQDTLEFLIAMLEHEPADRALCELADILRYVPGYELDAATDDALRTLIRAQSTDIHQATGRESVAIPGADPRLFEIGRTAVLHRRVRIGACSEVDAVRLLDGDELEIATLAASQYAELPYVRKEWEPIGELKLLSAAPPIACGQLLEVSGTWGYPAIPESVRQACAKLVIVRYLTDVTFSGTDFADALNESDVNIGGLLVSAREAIANQAIPEVA